MDKCFLNTEDQKQMVLKNASIYFNGDILKTLYNKLEVFPPPIVPHTIKSDLKPDEYEPIIVFNHRPNKEKSFNQFIKSVKRLRNSRQDFKVWIPLLKDSSPVLKEDWIFNGHNETKEKYFKNLQRCCVGISPKQDYGGWSISTTDGNQLGVPYVMYDSDNYKELNEGADFFKTDDDLIKLFNKYLDKKDHRKKMSEQAVENLITNHNFNEKIKRFSALIDRMMLNKKSIISTKSIEMISHIKEKSPITHRDLMTYLKWGLSIKFDKYRKTLLKTKHIRELKNWRTIYYYDKGGSKKEDQMILKEMSI